MPRSGRISEIRPRPGPEAASTRRAENGGRPFAVLKEAAALRPSPDVLYAYAMMLEKTGDLGEAVRQLKRYLETTTEGDPPRKQSTRRDLALWEKRLKRSA